VRFTDEWGRPDDVPDDVIDEVIRRTPGFAGWQQERWLYHCADAAAFLGTAGFEELSAHPESLDSIRAESQGWGWSDQEIEDHLRGLHRDGDATAYLFRCLHCGTHLAYSDSA